MLTSFFSRLTDYGMVTTLHILKSGEIVGSVPEFIQVQDRFSWVDRLQLVTKILRLRPLTDKGRKSFIVLYEDGHLIREYINMDENFIPLAFC
jgi:hypothetical protein